MRKWKKLGDSHFWAGLMKVKDTFLNHGSFHLNDGNQIRFWEDKWIGNHTFRDNILTFIILCAKKQLTVASVFSRVPLNVSLEELWQVTYLHCGMIWLLKLVMFVWIIMLMFFDGIWIRLVCSLLAQCTMHLLAMVTYSLTNICGN